MRLKTAFAVTTLPMLIVLAMPVLVSGDDAMLYTFTTLAGCAGSGAVDGTVSTARFQRPSGIAVDANGNVYVADSYNHTIRQVTPAGLVTTLAGLAGTSGTNDGIGNAARFCNPLSVAVDGAGNVFVADTANHTIRKVTPAGDVTTLAGLPGMSGTNDGTGNIGRFQLPSGIAVDSAGTVFVADTANHIIRKVTPAGVVTILAGLAGVPGNTDGTGNAARFQNPSGVAMDSAGNAYVADTSNHTLRKVTSAGEVTTLAGLAGNRGAADGTGSVARFQNPLGVAVNNAGDVLVADTFNHTIRTITPAGEVTTVAGWGGGPGQCGWGWWSRPVLASGRRRGCQRWDNLCSRHRQRQNPTNHPGGSRDHPHGNDRRQRQRKRDEKPRSV